MPDHFSLEGHVSRGAALIRWDKELGDASLPVIDDLIDHYHDGGRGREGEGGRAARGGRAADGQTASFALLSSDINKQRSWSGAGSVTGRR